MQLRFTVMILAVWLSANQASFAKTNDQTIQAYKLIQSHLTLGPIDVYYTNDAVKMVIKNNGSTLIARAPSWKVVVYRPIGRIAFESPFKTFVQTGLRYVPVPFIPDSHFHRVSEHRVNGETVVEYAEAADKGRNFRYWLIEPVNVPMEACAILDRAIRVPI